MERRGLLAYIPPHGTFKGGPDGFVYDEQSDHYTCQNGKHARFRKIKMEKDTEKRQYATRRADCRDCPFKTDCIGKGTEKRFSVVNQLQEYKRAIERVNSSKGQYYKRKRHSTVEPILGVLTQFMGLRKVNTKGINNANKQFLMAAVAYNLKKYLKFKQKVNQPQRREQNTLVKSIKEVVLSLLQLRNAFLGLFPRNTLRVCP